MAQKQIIAVVDDDAAVLSALCSLVRSLGLPVASFSSGEAFFSDCDIESVSFVICDIQMPGGMDGICLQEALAQRHPGVPVLFMTGLVDETVRRRVAASGAIAVMQKPLDDDALVLCINEHRVVRD